jgi:hypothetical protein
MSLPFDRLRNRMRMRMSLSAGKQEETPLRPYSVFSAIPAVN